MHVPFGFSGNYGLHIITLISEYSSSQVLMLIPIRDTTAVLDVYQLFIDAFCQTLFAYLNVKKCLLIWRHLFQNSWSSKNNYSIFKVKTSEVFKCMNDSFLNLNIAHKRFSQSVIIFICVTLMMPASRLSYVMKNSPVLPDQTFHQHMAAVPNGFVLLVVIQSPCIWYLQSI